MMSENPHFVPARDPQATPIVPEPVVINQFQSFDDLPSVTLRKGIDDEGNPWTPDLLLVEANQLDGASVSRQAMRNYAGKQFGHDFSGEDGILDEFRADSEPPFWVIRMENQKSRRKLITIRLFAAPAGYEDDALAWTPIDKFLFEIEPKQQAAVARKAELGALFRAWNQRAYFHDMGLPSDLTDASQNPAWIFVAAMLTDAALDHPENVCHCGSVQACNATAEGLDRRDPRYPFERMFRHSIPTTFSLLPAVGTRIFRLG